MSKKVLYLVTLVLVLGLATNASATNYNWLGGDGDWHLAANWAENGVPDSSTLDSAFIGTGTTVSINADAYAADLGISNGTLVQNSGYMQNQFGYDLGSQAWSVHEITSGASFEHSGEGGTVYNGVLVAADGSDVWFSGNGLTIQGSGTLLVEGSAMMEVGNYNEWWGRLTLDSGASVSVSGGASPDLIVGELAMDPGASMSLSGGGSVWLAPNNNAEAIQALVDGGSIYTPDEGMIVELSLSGHGGDPKYGGDNYLLHVIPEPATIALLGLGGLALLRRKR